MTRSDTDRIAGGDAVMLRNIRKEIASLGVEMQSVPIADLAQFKGDALHLTQIYQLDVAEAAWNHATNKHIPMFASPLFEEHLAIWFRQAIRKPSKWRTIASVLGQRTAELVYRQWQTLRRVGTTEWQRQRRIIEKAHLVPNSRYELRHLRSWFAVADLPAAIVPLGVDPGLYGDIENAQKKPLVELQSLMGRYVLQVGVISMRKNQDGLVRALMNSEVPIVFLGQPSPYEPEYCREVTSLAAQRKNVLFFDRLEERLLPGLYKGAAVHILPSWSERPGLVTLEAAACGCKVISTDRAPIQEYLGDLAWYCDPSDSGSIREAVQESISKPVPPDLASHILSQFTWRRTAERLRDVYVTVLES